VWITGATTGNVYGMITASSYSAPNTTVTISATGSLQSETLTGYVASLTPTNPSYNSIHSIANVKDFGAVGDNVADDTSAFTAAISAAELTGGAVYIPTGIYKITSTLTISAKMKMYGEANVSHNITDTLGSVIMKTGDFIGIEVTHATKGIGVTFEDFSVDSAGGADASVGIKLTKAGRTKLSRITVMNQGSHGIEFNSGNLSSFRDVSVLGNGGDGFKINGAAVPDTNACAFSNIDARGNIGIGVNLANCWNVIGQFTAQSNGGVGIYIDNCRQSNLILYGESNTGNDIELTNHANNEGNFIHVIFYNTFVDGSSGQNQIMRSKWGADTQLTTDNIRTHGLRLNNVTVAGALRFEKDQINLAQHKLYLDNYSGEQKLILKNVVGLTNEVADSPTYPVALKFEGATIERVQLTFTDLDTTPDVSLSEFWLADNSGATSITTFNSGRNGQIVHIMANNANTTFVHSATTTGLRLKGGANKTLGQYEGITFIRKAGDWWIEV